VGCWLCQDFSILHFLQGLCGVTETERSRSRGTSGMCPWILNPFSREIMRWSPHQVCVVSQSSDSTTHKCCARGLPPPPYLWTSLAIYTKLNPKSSPIQHVQHVPSLLPPLPPPPPSLCCPSARRASSASSAVCVNLLGELV
jgi:hypothetical protein